MTDISNDTNKKDNLAVAETEQSIPSAEDNEEKSRKERNPVRPITLIVLAVCLFLLVWLLEEAYRPALNQDR